MPILIDPTIAALSLIGEGCIQTMLELAETTPPGGCFCELGVYRGGAAWHLAQLATAQGRVLHLFDTFAGIPEAGPEDLNHKIGDFGDADLDAVKALIPQAIFHVGTFPGTMTDVGPVAFCHVDCDQYACCRAAIDAFWPLLPTGGVVLFDDWNCTTGVTQAVRERFGEPRLTRDGKAYVTK